MKLEHTQAAQDIEDIARRLREQGIASHGVCRVGIPGDALVQLAADLKPDLLILGAYGHRRLDNIRLGSTAEFVLRCLPCATLTIGPEMLFAARPMTPIHQILYASSVPVVSGQAVGLAELFARTSGAKVEILHIIDDQLLPRDHRSCKEIGEKGERIAAQLRNSGIAAKWKLCSGPAASHILDRAKEAYADIILFGIEHRPANPHLAGTISETIQRAACPVLTVPGPA